MSRKNTIEHIFSNLDKTSNIGCWIWTKAKDRDGYGLTRFNDQNITAHRLSYITHKGPIPARMFVCHTCDNPSCCNPDHLWLGTNQENQLDLRDKGYKWNGRPARPVMTPDGIFASRKEAATYYGIQHTSFSSRMKFHPTLYYYV
jgi:hypothetical protein